MLGATRSLLVAVVCSAGTLLSSSTASAAGSADLCNGHWVKKLGGTHAVTRQPLDDQASLRRRLPELEASIRTVVGRDPSLGPVVADALIAAIRDGAGITERPMRRDEAIHWMAYQPKPGQIEVISPACLRLERSYDSFEISVEIPEAASASQAANCAVSATRDCASANPKIAVDLRGSSPGARVTMSSGGEPAIAVGTGESFTIDDPSPYERDAVFTVRAQGAPATARSARVFRFLMPKICGNLAYLGEGPSRTIAAAGAPQSCEKSVRVALCAAPVMPAAVVEPAPVVATTCEAGWVARPFLFVLMPLGDERQRDFLLDHRPARETFEMNNGYGVGIAAEKRMGPVVGVEVAAMIGRGDSEYHLDNGIVSGKDSHNTNFYALTVGPNFHFLGCGGPDLYAGPFIGYGGFSDPNYWVADHHFRATFDGRFVWGAQLGLDVPFHGDGPWGFHGGLRYMKLSQDTDAGSIKVDPLIVEAGLSYRF